VIASRFVSVNRFSLILRTDLTEAEKKHLSNNQKHKVNYQPVISNHEQCKHSTCTPLFPRNDTTLVAEL